MTNEIITLNEMMTLGKLLEKYYDLLKNERNEVLTKTASIEYKCIQYSVKMEEMKKVSHIQREIKDRVEEMLEKECRI